MRKFLIPAAAIGTLAIAFVAMPAAAQQEEEALRGGARAIEQAAPMLDRSTDAALELDIGPLLDALDPYSPRGRRMTLREIGRSNDPDFDRKLRRSIYRGSARAAATLDAMATAAPSLRRSLREMQAAIGAAIDDARRPLPPAAYAPPPPPAGDEEDDDAPW